MKHGELTEKEQEVIHTLLFQYGVYDYKIIPDAPGGKSLPGSNYPGEIESFSGFFITAQKIYCFWLDWYEEHYTLGNEEGFWEEITLDEVKPDSQLYKLITKIQQKLQAKSKN